MKYTSYTLIMDPTTLETRIYLRREDAGEDSRMEDYLALNPEQADTLSGALVMSNANRKKAMIGQKGDRFKQKFSRKKQKSQ